MSLRGDRIKRARARVDARARDRAADINRSAAIKRYSTTPIKSRSFNNRNYNKQGGQSWDKKVKNYLKDKASSGIGAFTAGIKAAEELFFTPMKKAAQNKKIMGDLYKDKEYRDNVKESLMTGFGLREGQEGYEGSDQAFYDKYTRLAEMASDNQERERLQGIADSAFKNAQISSRLNYGLGTLGFDTIGKEPFESYTKPMFGESTSRFNPENFKSGIESTPTGKAFMAEAMKAKENDDGKSLVGNAMKSFGSPRGTFSSDAERYPQVPGGFIENEIAVEDIMPVEGVSNWMNIDDYNEIISPPFNAADMYGNLTLEGVRNKVFPGMNLEDITQEDLDNLSMQDRLLLGYSG